MNTFKTTMIITLLLLLTAIVYTFSYDKGSKVAYIKNTEVYNDFELRKELESKLTSVRNKRKTILDSLMLQLKMTSVQVEQNKGQDKKELQLFLVQKQDYLQKEKEFEEDSQRLASQYSQQIWKQINQYVSDFGKENNYSFIYGASGDGAIMFAQDRYDLTKELIVYINNKYGGEKK